MVGVSKQAEEEPTYRLLLAGMNDEALEIETQSVIWLFLTRVDGPSQEDIWQCECCRRECDKRGKPEIFKRAKAVILRDPRVRREAVAKL
jgi:hypothetical protein